jgi:hypothetical protein
MSFKNVILACAIALSVLSTSAIGAGGASLQLELFVVRRNILNV